MPGRPEPAPAGAAPGLALGRISAEREVVAWWAASRALAVACALALHLVRIPRGRFGRPELHPALGVLGSWDGRWYRSVAEHGYLLVPGRQSDPAFFPLYPILLRGLHAVGLPLLAAGITLSNAALLAGLLAFAALGRLVVGEELGRRAAILAAVTPVGVVYSMLYPEAVTLLALVLAPLLALRGRWLPAALAAAAAALGRPEGVLIAIPLAFIAARRWPDLDDERRSRAVAAVLAAPAALASFSAYLGWTLNDPTAWSRAERAWNRSFRVDGLVHAVTSLPRTLAVHPAYSRDLVFLVLYAVLLAAAARAGVGLEWIVFGALTIALPLFSGSIDSDARFGLLALPVYWGAASLVRGRLALRAVAGACLVLLAVTVVTLPLAFP